MVGLLQADDSGAAAAAAEAVASLAGGGGRPTCQALVDAGAATALVRLLSRGDVQMGGRSHAARALGRLAAASGTHRRTVVEAGAVQPLTTLAEQADDPAPFRQALDSLRSAADESLVQLRKTADGMKRKMPPLTSRLFPCFSPSDG
uniref:Uncharacterized protein n=1 Tax=Chlamydomonas euryale TaxID=1486919 RepID=A0A7R9V1H8_9CHLO